MLALSAFSSLASVTDTEKIDLISALNSYSLWSTSDYQDDQFFTVGNLSISAEPKFFDWMTNARNEYFLINYETTEDVIFLTATIDNAHHQNNNWQQSVHYDLIIPSATPGEFLKITLNNFVVFNALNWNLRPIAQKAPEQNLLMLLLHTFTKVMKKLRRHFCKMQH